MRFQQLQREPTCAFCAKLGLLTVATVADHITPHRGDQRLMWEGPLQSLCAAHHNSTKQRMEKSGFATDIGIDGYPTDPNHPVYQMRAGGKGD
jgi:5-methylcytosine-specific restriction endonuclease McrA